jgi:hypothetical protein
MKFAILRQLVEMRRLYRLCRKSRLFNAARLAIRQIRALKDNL